jgi:UDP-N-acetylmuramoylalanine--D-glutamate ligase
MFKLTKYNQKRIAILGLGIENEALVYFLLKHKVQAEITICDLRSPEQLGDRFIKLSKKRGISWQLGSEANSGLYKFDILFRAPGWSLRCPGIAEARKKNKSAEITSPLNLFFELSPSKNIVGVTGTKGKGTTSSLAAAILKAGKKKVWLGGNIGIAPFAFIEKMKKTDWVVLELSSFQLEDIRHSPKIAVFINFTRDHLTAADPNNPNFHRNMNEYWKAKTNIFMQPGNQYLIVNERMESRIMNHESRIGGHVESSKYKVVSSKKIIYFNKSKLESSLPGEHNKENIAAAEIVGKLAGVKSANIAKAVKNFKGLEHRIELVRELGGVAFYDDSFATTPDSTIIALRSFNNPVVILLGGAEKGADFRKLAIEVKRHCNFVVLLKGVSTPRIKKDLWNAGFDKQKMLEVNNIVDAVKLATKNAVTPGVVLLSTACASFGMFRNYKERGNLFKEEVRKIA